MMPPSVVKADADNNSSRSGEPLRHPKSKSVTFRPQ
jgi:hypothetical protein